MTIEYKTMWRINPDGTGVPSRVRVPSHKQPGPYWCGHLENTYADAREYAQRTTGEALRVAQVNSVAAWSLPETEPEETP